MLQLSTIDTETLGLLKSIQKVDLFQDLRLVGGTGLAMQLGHRKSIDIDLFGLHSADILDIKQELSKLGNLRILKTTKNIFVCKINDVLVDIVNFKYPWLEDEITFNDIKLAGLIDIAAMKISAISGRGTKKDFIDIFFLLKHFSLNEMLNAYQRKFPDGNLFVALKSMSYFEDSEEDLMPYMFNKINWQNVKQEIINQLNIYKSKHG